MLRILTRPSVQSVALKVLKYDSIYAPLVEWAQKFEETKHPRDKQGRFAESGGEDPPAVGPRIGFIWGDGKEHVGRKTGGLGGYSEDHTDTARRLLNDPNQLNAIRKGLEQGAIRYWVRRGELALNFKAGHPKTVTHAIKFLHDNYQDGDRIYLDIEEGDATIGKFFDNLGEANRAIRQQRKVASEHKFGNTQIQIAPHSSAAQSLNMARDAIQDEHLMADGKDVDPNHLTVRFGLLNEDLDSLRAFITRQSPFEAYIDGVELFPASEHSDGAVPVVARIACPELRAIESEIDQYADFKEKSFPVYKPHCTLAYCKPEIAPRYADLAVGGSFTVQSITISHASGVLETIPFGMVVKRAWTEAQHRRQPKGSAHGGEFTATLHGPQDALDSLLNGEKDVSIDRNDVRKFLEKAGEQHEDPDLTDLHVEGMEIFGGNGLGIEREDMPQIPPEHRQRFLEYIEQEGVQITEEHVNPLTLKPTQNAISARRVALKLAKYEKGNKTFPSVLVSKQDRILDGHHHWGMMAAFSLEIPEATMPIFRMHVSTKKALSLMHAYMKIHGLKRATLAGTVAKADPKTGRYVTPFVSFDRQGDEQLRMIASLNSSRLATWGFTAEAEVLGMQRYKLTAVLDGRTSKFCRLVDGKVFFVEKAREKVIEVLNVQDPNDLKVVQPWPKQTKAAMAEFAQMSTDDFVAWGLHIPPYHPHCRTLLRHVPSSVGTPGAPVPTVPTGAEIFQTVTQADLKELGIDATPEQVDQWNAHVGMTPVELLSKLSGLPPQEVMTKPLGVGATPITFEESGNIGFNVRGSNPAGVEFKLGALLDPFTGTYYLTQADLLAGNPKAELAFLKNLFTSLIDMSLKSSATSIALGVAGNAPYYAKLGFLPDDLEWDSLRTFTLGELDGAVLQPVMASLSSEDRLLVKQLLQDKSVGAMQALVELPFTYQGKTLGEWLFGEAVGTWELDLMDEGLIAQARAYLS